MLESGYNPEEMIEVMEVLKEASGGGDRPSEFQSTYPDPDHRIIEIKKKIWSSIKRQENWSGNKLIG